MKKTERKTKATPVNRTGDAATAAETGHSSTSAEPETGEYLSLTEIKELIGLISEKQFNEFELEFGGFRLRLQKGLSKSAIEQYQQAPYVQQAASESKPVEFVSPMTGSAQPAAAAIPQEEKLHVVASPIVGTFYRAPSPTAEPFVKLGDAIEAGKTLCIIEAMKLMNEIQSDASGTVVKIFVENGQPVEYGQPLFGIEV
jgi:acetyl-CoA carboxylase biotin carboxyl carrier protein